MAYYLECQRCGFKVKIKSHLGLKFLGVLLAFAGYVVYKARLFLSSGFNLEIAASLFFSGLVIFFIIDEVATSQEKAQLCPICRGQKWKLKTR